MTPPEIPRRQRALGALLGTFVGDTLGMPYEGLPPEAIPGRLEMEEARLGRGTYTDDTEMMIALAEALAEHGEIEPSDLARRFLDGHDPRRGYGGGTLRVFELWRRGVSVGIAARLVFGGEGSLGNGAAMRIAPVGVRFADNPKRLHEEARRSAAVTHVHPVGVDSAVVQAAAVGAAVRGDQVLVEAVKAARSDELRRGLAAVERLLMLSTPPEPADVAAELGHSSAGHKSVPAAIYAACEGVGFRETVSFAVRCGGDTDTIGAMAGAIAGAWSGADAIPAPWLAALEDGPRGRSHVESLAVRLT